MDDITIIKTAYLVLLTLRRFSGVSPIHKLLTYMQDRIALEEGKPSREIRDECMQISRYRVSVEMTLRYIMAEAEKGDEYEKENSSNDS